jgi:hypothetical protein
MIPLALEFDLQFSTLEIYTSGHGTAQAPRCWHLGCLVPAHTPSASLRHLLTSASLMFPFPSHVSIQSVNPANFALWSFQSFRLCTSICQSRGAGATIEKPKPGRTIAHSNLNNSSTSPFLSLIPVFRSSPDTMPEAAR